MPTAQSPARILLVEDEPKLRQTLAEGFGLEDWSVTSAASGSETQRLLGTQEFDAIVLDWILPDCDGLDIVRRLRAQANGLPVLIISARNVANAAARVREAGATDYLPKPFSFEELLGRTRALLNGKL